MALFNVRLHHLLKGTVVGYVLLSVLFVAGCSSDPKKETPAELQLFERSAKLVELWKVSVGSGNDDQFLFLQPHITQNTIFAIDAYGELVAINKETGKKQLSFDLDEAVVGGLGGDADNLYYTTFNGEIVSIKANLDAEESGSAPVEEKWRAKLSSEAIAPPQSNGDIVVVQTVDGKVAGYNQNNGDRRWVYQSDQPVLSLRGTSTPWVADEYTVAGFASGELVQLDNDSGEPNWQKSIAFAQGRTELERLVDIDGKVGVSDGTLFAVSYQGNMKAVDPYSGTERWTKNASSYVAIELDESSLYFSAANGDVVAIDKTNRAELWRQSALQYRQLTSPALFDDTIAVGDFEGFLHVLSKDDGRLIARARVDTDGVRAPLQVENDVLYVYGNGGILSAFRIVIF